MRDRLDVTLCGARCAITAHGEPRLIVSAGVPPTLAHEALFDRLARGFGTERTRGEPISPSDPSSDEPGVMLPLDAPEVRELRALGFVCTALWLDWRAASARADYEHHTLGLEWKSPSRRWEKVSERAMVYSGARHEEALEAVAQWLTTHVSGWTKTQTEHR